MMTDDELTPYEDLVRVWLERARPLLASDSYTLRSKGQLWAECASQLAYEIAVQKEKRHTG